jgi:nitrate reductase assembly molybdenum cofactor insertion protein NarJ
MAGVASQFSDLGMSADMVNQFVPVILEHAQTAASEQAMQLLQGAFTAL